MILNIASKFAIDYANGLVDIVTGCIIGGAIILVAGVALHYLEIATNYLWRKLSGM